MDSLLQRYLDMENSGIGNYFDADEIIQLLDYFEVIGDYDHYYKFVHIGQKMHPHNTEIYTRVCHACFYTKRYERALALIESTYDKGNQELILTKCQCLCALERYDELTAYLETLATLPADDLQLIYEHTAQTLYEQDESNHSCDLLQRGLDLFPDSVRMKEVLCYCLEMQGKISQAIEICKELVDNEPYSVDYWYMLGRLYTHIEAYEKAIDAFDYALVADATDIEIKMLQAFCYYVLEKFDKVDELYWEIFQDDAFYVGEYMRIAGMLSDEYVSMYALMKEIIKKFDNRDIDNALLELIEEDEFEAEEDYDDEDEDEDEDEDDEAYEEDEDDEYGIEYEETGVMTLAHCFPAFLIFLLLQEIASMAEGEQDAIQNVEQIMQMIYQKGVDGHSFRIDVNSKFCLAPKQKVANLLETQMSSPEDNDLVSQTIQHLLDGNITLFCQQYAQCLPEAISAYLDKLFQAGVKRNRQHFSYLRSDEINRNDDDPISSDELSTTFMNNRNLHN